MCWLFPMSHTDPLPCWFWEVLSFQHWWSMAKLLWHTAASFRGALQLPQRHTNHQKQWACNLWKGPLEAIHKSVWVNETKTLVRRHAFQLSDIGIWLVFHLLMHLRYLIKAYLMVPHQNSPLLCIYLLQRDWFPLVFRVDWSFLAPFEIGRAERYGVRFIWAHQRPLCNWWKDRKWLG